MVAHSSRAKNATSRRFSVMTSAGNAKRARRAADVVSINAAFAIRCNPMISNIAKPLNDAC